MKVEAKVGLFVVIGILVFAYMSTRVGEISLTRDRGYEVYVYFHSASGLAHDVPVEIAGVEVGRVVDIALDDKGARVTLRLKSDVLVRKDVRAIIRTKGVLGDKYVELVQGSMAAPPLKDGDRIIRSISPVDTDALLGMLGEIGSDFREMSRSLAEVLGGEQGRDSVKKIISNLEELTTAMNRVVNENDENLSVMVANLSEFSRQLKKIGDANSGDIHEMIVAMRNASARLDKTLSAIGDLSETINRGEGTLGRLVHDDTIMARIDDTLGSLQEISGKIERGEGTVGRLIKDEETVDEINKVLENVNDYLGKQETFRTFLGYRGEYLAEDGEFKSYISLRIQPKQDKYYLAQIVEDPRDEETVTHTVTTIDGVTTVEQKTITEESDLKFSLQIAKRYYDLGFRAGLFESTGGAAIDYYLFRDRLTLSFEAFDFDPDENAHLKLKVDYSPFPHIHLTTGIDDFTSDVGKESFFLGAGISFSDDDIKTLLSSVPIPTN